jgi:hypothetical protein
MKILFVILALSLAMPLSAQTVTLTATGHAEWTDPTPSTVPVTKYTANVFLKTVVTGSAEPTTPPALVLDFGKPAPAAGGVISSPPLVPLVPANVEYVMFLHTAGPGGVSGPSNASAPFLSPVPPQPAAALVIRP